MVGTPNSSNQSRSRTAVANMDLQIALGMAIMDDGGADSNMLSESVDEQVSE